MKIILVIILLSPYISILISVFMDKAVRIQKVLMKFGFVSYGNKKKNYMRKD